MRAYIASHLEVLLLLIASLLYPIISDTRWGLLRSVARHQYKLFLWKSCFSRVPHTSDRMSVKAWMWIDSITKFRNVYRSNVLKIVVLINLTVAAQAFSPATRLLRAHYHSRSLQMLELFATPPRVEMWCVTSRRRARHRSKSLRVPKAITTTPAKVCRFDVWWISLDQIISGYSAEASRRRYMVALTQHTRSLCRTSRSKLTCARGHMIVCIRLSVRFVVRVEAIILSID